LRANGVRFTKPPDTYYDKLAIKHPELDIATLRKHGILCDVLDGAFLLQIFTTPICDRPAFFYEIIQRVNNYSGFGLNNIRALFDAIETEIAGSMVS
jgi:4-hydroxyphenylpyruvate dioxygenase